MAVHLHAIVPRTGGDRHVFRANSIDPELKDREKQSGLVGQHDAGAA
jgi:hypothetical protein